MTVRLTRSSHGGLPQEAGIEIDDDGRARTWQTSGRQVGRCGRDLSASERTALEKALATARSEGAEVAPGAPDQPVSPEGATEQLTADGVPDVEMDVHGTPPPGSGELIELLRTLREDLADSPLAAIRLEVEGSPLAARLRHVGTEPVVLRVGSLSVRATTFDKDSAILGSETRTVDAPSEHGPVGPGWTLPLTDDLGVAAPPQGGFLTVHAGTLEVDALGDGVLRGAELSWMLE